MTPSDRQFLIQTAGGFGTQLQSEALDRLEVYLDLLRVWGRTIRLVAETDELSIVQRHISDSLAPLAHLPASGRLGDIGSGAGFPGVVLGCVRPDLDILLIEARRRRASFLRDVARRIPLPQVLVIEDRAEALQARLGRTLMATTARAIRLDLFLRLSAPLLAPGGSAIAMQTPQTSRFDVERLCSESGFALGAAQDYRLPGDRERRILVFRRIG